MESVFDKNLPDMKRPVILTFILSLALVVSAFSQDKNQQDQKRYGMYAVAFYNQENLFDTIDDPLIHDEDFLIGATYGWNGMKYRRKLRNMSTVLASIATDKGLKNGAAIIGLAEVENRAVVEDLVRSEALRDRGYRILHYDSPDARGIDCALSTIHASSSLRTRSTSITSIPRKARTTGWVSIRTLQRT